MKTSLVIAPQWIGDAVMTEPLMRRLAQRGERLTVGALPWVAPVYRAMPHVAQVVDLPFAHGGLQWKARRNLAKQWSGQFDCAYICPNSIKSALLPLLAGIPKRVGYLGEARVGLLTHRLKNPAKGQRPPMVAFYSALSGESGVESDKPTLVVSDAAIAQALIAQGNLAANGAGANASACGPLQRNGYYVFAPGAEYGPAKRWPANHFAELASRLALPVLLLGSGKEAALCAEIAATANAGKRFASGSANTAFPVVLDLSGRTSLDEALALIAGAKAMVSNDSGLMHVAAALHVPQVAVFGSSSPLHTPPLSDRAQVVWLKNDSAYQPALDCAPCFERECPLGHTRCLVDIQPDRLLHFL
jgi:heptosyltransferase-2